MKLLLIEDDEQKLQHIVDFLNNAYPDAKIVIARSFASGLRALIAGAAETDLLLLDMSMPNYDISHTEPTGGVPESFAGQELLAQMQLRNLKTPTIVVTMFDVFGEKPNRKSLEILTQELKVKYSPPFEGLVHYSSRQEGWQQALKKIINRIVEARA